MAANHPNAIPSWLLFGGIAFVYAVFYVLSGENRLHFARPIGLSAALAGAVSGFWLWDDPRLLRWEARTRVPGLARGLAIGLLSLVIAWFLFSSLQTWNAMAPGARVGLRAYEAYGGRILSAIGRPSSLVFSLVYATTGCLLAWLDRRPR